MPNNFNNTILIAPLDWGIGHATRCVPLINQLLQLNCKVIIAAEGLQKQLLQLEFPDLQVLPLPGYRITYSKQKRFFSLKIVLQLPKILRAIQQEKKWLKQVVSQYGVDAVISDNRYGLNHAHIKCVIITHQLIIKAPIRLAEFIMQRLNYQLIRQFNECWVPDESGSVNLAGSLSHPAALPKIPVRYLGALSRLNAEKVSVIRYDLLCIISGPEPQRTLFENQLLKDLQQYEGQVLFIRGLPGSQHILPSFQEVTIVNHLAANELEQAFNASNFVISRSGYTTVMDLCKLQKKAILVPTPGQTEQEYLARHLEKQQWCLYFSQDKFNLHHALKKAANFPFKIPFLPMTGYKQIVNEFVKSL